MHEQFWLQDPRVLLSGRALAFDWVLAGNRRKTRIVFPDLKKNKLDTWGDWGPMHSIVLEPHQQVLVHTACEEGSYEQVSHLRPGRLHLESPMRAAEREVTPLVLTIEDNWRGFHYRLGIGRLGRVGSAEVTQVEATAARRPLLRLLGDEQVRSLQWGGLA